MLSTLYIILFFVANAEALKAKLWKFNNCSLENLEECGRVMLFYGNRDLELPSGPHEMETHCNEEKSATRCAQAWSKTCVTGIQRQIMVLLMRGASKNIKERCEPKGSAWFFENYKCVKDSLEPGHLCMDMLIADLTLIRRLRNRNNWIPAMCCYATKWRKCFDKAIESHCDDEGKKFLNWCVNSYLGDLLDIACSNQVFGSDTCKRILRRLPRRKSKAPKSNKFIMSQLYSMFVELSDDSSITNKFLG